MPAAELAAGTVTWDVQGGPRTFTSFIFKSNGTLARALDLACSLTAASCVLSFGYDGIAADLDLEATRPANAGASAKPSGIARFDRGRASRPGSPHPANFRPVTRSTSRKGQGQQAAPG